MAIENRLQPETRRHRELALRIGREAVRKAQQRTRDMGVANVYSRDGQIYWELPDGRITFEDPYREGGPLSHVSSRRRPASS